MTISITNTGTTLKKLGKVLRAVTAIVLIYGGYIGVNDWYSTKSSKAKVRNIEAALNIRDFDLASKLISESEKKKSIESEEVLRLKSLLENRIIAYNIESEKNSEIVSLEGAIARYDSTKASLILSNINNSEKYTLAEKDNLKRKLEEISDEGLFKKLISSSGERKIELAKEYLEVYKNGNKRKEVIAEQLTAEYTNIYRAIDGNGDIESILGEIKRLNSDLEKFSREGIILTNRLPLDAITNIRSNYLNSTNHNAKIKVGARVRISGSTDQSWGQYYRDERDSFIPAGSIGEIVALEGPLTIKFPQLNFEWKTDFVNSIKELSAKNKAPTAWYKMSEITCRNTLDAIEKFSLEKEMDKLEDNLKFYR